MVMTHYMDLMMGSWYLLVLFMAVPMALAEAYVVSEILILMKGEAAGAGLKSFNHWSIYIAAVVITALCLYAGAEFAKAEEWRTWVDVVASVSYVACFIPIVFIAAIEAGVLMKGAPALKKGYSAVAAVVAYLILAHMAMVFGMFDPMQFGYQPKDGAMMMHHGMNHQMGGEMPAMHHEGCEGAAPAAGDGCPAHAGSQAPAMDHSKMGHDMPAMDHSRMGHDMPAMDHSKMGHGMPDHSGMKAPEGAPIPPGYHRMADGTLMKNGAPMGPAPAKAP